MNPQNWTVLPKYATKRPIKDFSPIYCINEFLMRFNIIYEQNDFLTPPPNNKLEFYVMSMTDCSLFSFNQLHQHVHHLSV